MSEINFRAIKEQDVDQVFILLNQLLKRGTAKINIDLSNDYFKIQN